MIEKIKSIVDGSDKIVIIQADNPDGDSLASALALEEILGDLGKNPFMYCGVEIPSYLRYMDGWDRISHELPKKFDSSIIVDTSAIILLETLGKNNELGWIKSKPSIVIDHHLTEPTIDFADVMCIETAVSTTEIIHQLSKKLKWDLSKKARQFIVMGILSDSLGLVSGSTSARSIRIIAEQVEAGVVLAEIDNLRREAQKKKQEILSYKGRLLQRVEYSDDGRVALIEIPWKEIEKYSHLYNPSMLVLDEMRQVEGVCVAIALKSYPDKRITGKIRANIYFTIADKLAEHFGGGGHPYASGFRVTDGRDVAKVKSELLFETNKLLDRINSK